MPDIKERVQEIVREDPFLYEPLARGILNRSETARWIRDNRGVEGEEETIRSAITDLESDGDLAPAADVHPLLATAHLDIRSDVVSITLERREGIKSQLLEFLGSLSLRNGETFHSAVNEEEILLVVQEDRLETAREIFGSLIIDDEEELTAMTFSVDDGSGFGLLGIVLEVLSMADFDIITVDGDSTEASVILPTSQHREALRTVDSFGVDADA